MAMYEVFSSDDPKAKPEPTVMINIVPGSMIWVPDLEAEEEAFELANVLSRSGNVVTAQMHNPFAAGAYRVVDLSKKEVKVRIVKTKKKIGKQKTKEIRVELPPCLPANDMVVADMTELQYTHKSAILYNLKMRAQMKEPYTFIGSVLVSINPLQHIDDPEEFDSAPHPGTIAERAYNKMTFSVSQRRRVLEDNPAYLSLLEDDFEEGEDISHLKQEIKDLVAKLAEQFGPVDHSILISGESGAGKSEGAKRVLCRLVDREGFGEVNYYDDRPEAFDFQDRLIGATPILESFGNAKTHRNPNSSRFGKFLKLWYEPDIDLPDDFCLFGASITTYLLERSRVTFQEEGEKNYRIFYQLLTSPNRKLHKMLGFRQAGHTFQYLGNKKFTKEDTDRSGYVELRTAFQMADIKVRTFLIFQVVAAVLHLGNIQFNAETTGEGDIAVIDEPEGAAAGGGGGGRDSARKSVNRKRISAKRLRKSVHRASTAMSKTLFNPRSSFITMVSYTDTPEELLNTTRENYSPLYFASRLLGVPKESLRNILTTSKVKVGREKITKQLDVHSAERRRDALAKHLYASLFDWLVSELNNNLYGEVQYGNEELKSFIGVLDVFGFEEFERNGFEQLLINYANEVLLSLFTREILIGERQLYADEGLQIEDGDIDMSAVENSDSANCLELFDGVVVKKKRTPGLFSVIDSQGKIPSPSDKKMLQQMQKDLGKMKAFLKAHPSRRNEVFIVRHYASTVTYTVGSFLEKNDQALPPEVGEVFGNSSHTIVASFTFGAAPPAKDNIRKKRKKKKTTVIGSYATQMNDLRNTLLSTNCSYIRCVKPNPTMYFNPEAFKHEIANSMGGNRGKALRLTESKLVRMKKEKTANSKRTIVPKQKYFNNEYISAQLKNLGIYDCVSVLKAGLPTRMPYPNFVEMYSEILPMDEIPFFRNESKEFKSKLYVSALMFAFEVPRDGFKLGNTRIFFQNGQLDAVKTILKSGLRMTKLPPESKERMKIMSRFRMFYAKRRWRFAYVKVVAVNHFLLQLKRTQAVRILQKFARQILFTKQLRLSIRQKKAATIIQKYVRAYLAKILFLRLLKEKEERERKEREAAEEERLRLLEEQRKREEEERRLKREREEREREEAEAAEKERLRLEEEARRQAEELERLRKEKEELERRRKLEEEERERREEEARIKREKEAAELARKKKLEEEEEKKRKEAEAAARAKRKKEAEDRRLARELKRKEEEAEAKRIKEAQEQLKQIKAKQKALKIQREKEEKEKKLRDEREAEEKKIREFDRKNRTSTVDFDSTFGKNEYGNNALRGHVQKYFHKRASFNRLKRTQAKGEELENVDSVVPQSKLSVVGNLFNYKTVRNASEEEWKEVELTLLDLDGDDADVDLIDDFDDLSDVDGDEGAVQPEEEIEVNNRKSLARNVPGTLPQRMRNRKMEVNEHKKMKKSPTKRATEAAFNKFEDKMAETIKEQVLAPAKKELKPKPKKKKSRRVSYIHKNRQRKSVVRKVYNNKPKAPAWQQRKKKEFVDPLSLRHKDNKKDPVNKIKAADETRDRAASDMSGLSMVERMALRFGGKNN